MTSEDIKHQLIIIIINLSFTSTDKFKMADAADDAFVLKRCV